MSWKAFLPPKTGLVLIPLALALSGCLPVWRSYPPPRPNEPMPYHQNWCYRSLGYAECYAHPQNVLPDNLINVDPAALYPQTPEDYRKTLGKGE